MRRITYIYIKYTLGNTLHKSERLSSRKRMEYLFEKGRSKTVAPVKVIYILAENMPRPAQAMFVVPKRRFKRANERNVLKRRMREAYRLSKTEFYKGLEATASTPALAFLYIGNKEENYATIKTSVNALLSYLTEEITGKAKRDPKK